MPSGVFNQFSVFFETEGRLEPMTPDNCADYKWISLSEEKPTTETRVASLICFLTMVIKFITRLLNGEIALTGSK